MQRRAFLSALFALPVLMRSARAPFAAGGGRVVKAPPEYARDWLAVGASIREEDLLLREFDALLQSCQPIHCRSLDRAELLSRIVKLHKSRVTCLERLRDYERGK
jgi:hypothetical protein